jgi:hypothetical protein
MTMAWPWASRVVGRGRVGGGRGRRGRGGRFRVEELEGRICPSSAAPTWTSLGPAPANDLYNVNLANQSVLPPQLTGAVQALATFNTPGGPTGAYAGGALGGIWRTDNLFAGPPTWVTNSDALPSLAINTLAVSPLDPTGNTVFAGTGGTSNGGINTSNNGILGVNPAALNK